MSGWVDVEFTHKNGKKSGIVAPENTKIVIGLSAEKKAALRQAALAYQDTLTKAGHPRKIK